MFLNIIALMFREQNFFKRSGVFIDSAGREKERAGL